MEKALLVLHTHVIDKALLVLHTHVRCSYRPSGKHWRGFREIGVGAARGQPGWRLL